ncbi:hypothetical protein, partial [Actinotalea sp. C106]|uniref:hypothetical protein n=1 Tax=Actinotalea sp. C106 TaxID=2908644 RepID=UPI002028DA0B
MTPPPRLRAADVAVAAGTWLVAGTLLLSMPAIAAMDPEVAMQAPTPGTLAWWLGLSVITAQAVALLWRRLHPRVVLVAVAGAVPVGGLVGLDDALGTTTVPLLVAAYATTVSGPFRRAAPALAAAAGLMGLGTLLALPEGAVLTLLTVGAALGQAAGTVGLAVLAGVVVRARRETTEARERQIQALRREHEAR